MASLENQAKDRNSEGDSIPAERDEAVGLNVAQKPAHYGKGNNCCDERSEQNQAPVLGDRAWGRMVQGFEDLPPTRCEHGWNAHDKRKLRGQRAVQAQS